MGHDVWDSTAIATGYDLLIFFSEDDQLFSSAPWTARKCKRQAFVSRRPNSASSRGRPSFWASTINTTAVASSLARDTSSPRHTKCGKSCLRMGWECASATGTWPTKTSLIRTSKSSWCAGPYIRTSIASTCTTTSPFWHWRTPSTWPRRRISIRPACRSPESATPDAGQLGSLWEETRFPRQWIAKWNRFILGENLNRFGFSNWMEGRQGGWAIPLTEQFIIR